MADTFSVLTDRQGQLSAGSGSIAGMPAAAVQVKPLFERFAEDDRPKIRDALNTASHQTATVVYGLRVLTSADEHALFDITLEPAGPDKYWARFAMAEGVAAQVGPVAKADFLSGVAERLGLSDAPEMQMLMIDFGGLRDTALNAWLGADGARDMRNSIEDALSEASVDGQVGRLGAGSYGVLGALDVNKEDLVASVVDVADKMGVSEDELGAHAESVALDTDDTDPQTLGGLLSHVCHKFGLTIRNGVAFGGNRLSDVSEELQQAISLVETALDNDDIAIDFRAVHLLASGAVELQLAHGALIFGDEKVPVDRILDVAAHQTLCARHDRTITQRAFAATDPGPTLIIDICLPTLESGAAADIAAEAHAAGRKVGFRPSGLDISARRSTAARQAYRLLEKYIPIWLMNFSTAVSKTRQLHGAYVEISAPFLRDISAGADRNEMLSKLLKVWNDVEVHLVAVNVASKNLASFVSKLGIAYGVGIAADPAADAPQSTRDVKS
jgi:EAL domain-containing protein (putative c-di-GMP-specific phosphodiesterase class I)